MDGLERAGMRNRSRSCFSIEPGIYLPEIVNSKRSEMCYADKNAPG